MSITIHPRVGQILICDFSQGFKAPEMVKARPVVVIGPARDGLVTVVALSTKVPPKIMPYHYLMPAKSMPQLGRFEGKESWLKGDMIYTVGFHRLDLIKLGKKNSTGKRVYFINCLGREQMAQIYTCVLAGLNLQKLSKHLSDE